LKTKASIDYKKLAALAAKQKTIALRGMVQSKGGLPENRAARD
jgi:hypothetical protein